MIHAHSSTPRQRAYWVSKLVASEATYGVVSQMSRDYQVSRQTLYSWKERGQSALEAAFEPRKVQREAAQQLERAVLTLLVEGHASYRGIQACLNELLGLEVESGHDFGYCANGRTACPRLVGTASASRGARGGLG